jgi:glycogen operon protein
VFSSTSIGCTLVLFEKNAPEPFAEIPFPDEFEIGDVYCMIVFGLDFDNLEYGYKMDGPFRPEEGHRFDKTKILSDPYSRALGGRDVWMADPNWDNIYPHRSRIIYQDFDWEGDHPLETPIEDLIIYEAHVRAFTKDKSSGVKAPGTFSAIREKIPHLKKLGINCIELMPIYEFDEWEHSKENPETGETLVNFWGYSTINFFAPKAGYAATGKFGMQVDELKTLIKDLHRNGIEVLLDVVFNHTAEGNERGPYISFRGLDNKVYYMLTPEGYYFNFSGTGNTLNCNHPRVRNMVLDCLRYWAAEFHIDGFRFDLAAILGRDQSGVPLNNPPLVESLAYDPILSSCKLIAEAWDAGGLYQVGSFPAYGRWGEWNGKYRDSIRKVLKSEKGLIGELSQRIQGSPDLYFYRGPTASINFITCHDGFTMMDMVSYNEKHNEANGEDNNDGANDNNSWNCGVEGPTDDPAINFLRRQQVKNALTILMVSQGVPMLLMGDEMGRTKHGNNNTYCHDNELNWLNWDLLEENADLFNYTQRIIQFRKAHPVLRSKEHFQHRDYKEVGLSDISFHGTSAWRPDWTDDSLVFAYMLSGDHAKGGTIKDDTLYIAINMYWDGLEFELPQVPGDKQWHIFANTSMPAGKDISEVGAEILLEDQHKIVIGGRSIVILVNK